MQPHGMDKFNPPDEACRDRIEEIATILAAGLMRALAGKSSTLLAETGESSLDFSPVQSGHPTKPKRRRSNG